MARVVLQDGIQALESMHKGSVRLILTDLPSGETRAKFDRKVDMDRFWPAAWDALHPSGTIVVFASSLRFASEIISHRLSAFKYDLVWSKSLATGFLNAHERPLRAHEFILVSPGATYHPQMMQGASPIHKARRHSHGENYNQITQQTDSREGATDRFPTSVLEYSTVGTSSAKRTHPQQKPLPLLRWLIRTYTNEMDTVVDPFAGSGSTGDAAIQEGRRYYCCDRDPRFGTYVLSGEEKPCLAK